MQTYRDEVLRILREVDNNTLEAAERIFVGPQKICIYVLQCGLETFKAQHRRKRRQELRTEIQPQFKAGRVTGSVELTKAAKERLIRHTKDLFGDDGWMIGEINLGNFTKEQLLAQAVSERNSAKGSIRNAQFYESLADPLQAGQMVKEYWKSGDARKLRKEIWDKTEGSNPQLR